MMWPHEKCPENLVRELIAPVSAQGLGLPALHRAIEWAEAEHRAAPYGAEYMSAYRSWERVECLLQGAIFWLLR